ncbi:hypothetical protein HGT71_06015 [Rosenbergiella epipactidis]|uniref:phage tail protein n=1 Tax=Rosenbergiella epipactidis TaxID=1544694 RepID=UPI001BDA3D8B|nr:phage tail protein [Rosenbergiella epipactidis]MBT0717828.1 hypothetical protein [Rosenbergiella epipactidis]
MDDFYSIITNLGKKLEIEALASDSTIRLTQFVIGDASGKAIAPNTAQTKLINEKFRGDISALVQSPDQHSQLMAKLVLPPEIGGFTVREIGLLTDKGELYALANCAAIEKPKGGVSIHIQFRLAVSETANISLNVATGEGLFLRIDQALEELAVQGPEIQQRAREALAVLEGKVGKRGLVELSNTIDEADDKTAATPKALSSVKSVADAAAKSVNDKKPDPKGNIQLGSAADAELIESEETSAKGQVLTVGDFGLGLKQSQPISIDFNTYVFHNGAHILLDVSNCRNVPHILTGGHLYALCIGNDHEQRSCTVLFIDKANMARIYIGLRSSKTNGWKLLTIANQDYVKNYLPLIGGNIEGDLSISGTHTVSGRSYIEKSGVGLVFDNQRQTNGLRVAGYGNLKAEIFHLENIGHYHCLGIHVANGGANGWFEFRNNGEFVANGSGYFGGNVVLNYGGQSHCLQSNGDIVETQGRGSVFRAFWNATTLQQALQHITNRANDAWNKSHDAQVNRVQDIRLSGIAYLYAGRNTGRSIVPEGAVFIGCDVQGEWDNNEGFYYSYIQKLINGNWVTVGRA